MKHGGECDILISLPRSGCEVVQITIRRVLEVAIEEMRR